MSNLWRTIKSSISALRSSEDQYGKAFIIASDTGDLDKMLEHIGKRGVSYQDEYGQRPLHRASRRGHASAVRMLLEYGCDPNATDLVGAYTAIQYAAHYQHSEVVRLLVSYGADVYYQNRIACRPATYYAHKYISVRRAIQQGTSDLYIHRSIACSFLIDNLDQNYFNNGNNSISLKHSIALLIVEFIPRHQLWTQVKTRYITNSTTNWNSCDLFSEKHLEDSKQNKIHSCQYHGEFDIDKDWDKICKLRELTNTNMDDSYSDCDYESSRSSNDEDEEENKYNYSHSSRTSLSDSSDDVVNKKQKRNVTKKRRSRMHCRNHRRVTNNLYAHIHTHNDRYYMHNIISGYAILLLVGILISIIIAICLYDVDFDTIIQIIYQMFFLN
eukprot:526816_1